MTFDPVKVDPVKIDPVKVDRDLFGRDAPISRRIVIGSFAVAALASLRRAGFGQVQATSESAEEWANWSGSVHWKPRRVARPSSVDEVVQAVREATEHGESLRVAGTGHSFVPLCATPGTTLLLSQLSGIESLDRERREATVLAGTKLYQLHGPLREAGLAMETLPDIDRQTLAGAIATATHGTGRGLPSLSALVTGLRLVDGRGRVVECSRDQRPDLLAAAQVSLGALGVLTHVRLRLVPAFRLHERTWIAPFDECRQELAQRAANHRHFEFFWVSDRDACLMKTLDTTTETENREHFEDPDQLVGERVGDSGAIFPSLRNRRFNEIEYSLAEDQGPDCLVELRELMLTKHREVTWPIEYRTVAAEDAWLSQMHGRPSVTISLHQAAQLDHEPLFQDAEAIFRNHGGRPHWGKIHTLEAAALAPLYPRWSEFSRVRQELDPQGRFLTPYLRRLLV